MNLNSESHLTDHSVPDNKFCEWLHEGIRAVENNEETINPIAHVVKEALQNGRMPQFRSMGEYYQELAQAYFKTQRYRIETLMAEGKWFRRKG